MPPRPAPPVRAIHVNAPRPAQPSFTPLLASSQTTDGDGDTVDEKADDAEGLASKQSKGKKLATVGRGARGSKIHDTKQAMADETYSQAGSE